MLASKSKNFLKHDHLEVLLLSFWIIYSILLILLLKFVLNIRTVTFDVLKMPLKDYTCGLLDAKKRSTVKSKGETKLYNKKFKNTTIPSLKQRDCSIGYIQSKPQNTSYENVATDSDIDPVQMREIRKQERHRRLEEAKRIQEEILEKQRQKKEEMAEERERINKGMMAVLFHVLTQPLVQETKQFNEWVGQPD
ncbi:unnamed protein product [Orchesella dallaii]|uniref:Uncharacterized protein n=1 Tax=Orchesella dallaii TaxID=48710 RepID=A0ABP1QPB5_9HEXA